ncbi:hypothetical protein HAALTHF_51270n [Vreelandella aquamarina]|nr:hypothetical protein HAALTHF_51270n [Halomonas axialensis]
MLLPQVAQCTLQPRAIKRTLDIGHHDISLRRCCLLGITFTSFRRHQHCTLFRAKRPMGKALLFRYCIHLSTPKPRDFID